MKKILTLLLVMGATLPCLAQFEKGKGYAAMSVTGLDMSYSGKEKFTIGLEGKVGYTLIDDLMVLANISWQHQGGPDEFSVGVGGRYYIIQNGLYLGINVKYLHANHSYDDVLPGLEVGYAFFLNQHVTIEPAIYYDQSFHKHSDYSKIGLKVGFGIYI